MSCLRLLPYAVVLAPVHAAELAPVNSTAIGWVGFFQVLLALGFVLSAVMAAAWLLRRLAVGAWSANSALKVVAGVMVGGKERVVVVEVQGTWLVLGVTAAEITALHTLPKPEGPTVAPAEPPVFAARLAAFLRQQNKTTIERSS